jgi:glycerol-3-phosphate dehydrogenase
MYDVAIIGAGISGASAAYFLSQRKLKICVIEKENDVSMGTTKANSAIVHAGYDPKPGTLMARFNVRGAAMIKELSAKLSVPYEQIGSLVLAFDETDLALIEKLYRRGIENGVPDLQLLGAQETLEKEPNLNPEVKGSLYAPTAGIVAPWELCIAMCEVAAQNGCNFKFDSEVTAIDNKEDSFVITTAQGKVEAKYIINAAGVYSDKVCAMSANAISRFIRPKGSIIFWIRTRADW